MERLKAWLEANNIDQAKAAEIGGISQPHVSLILSGKRNLTVNVARKYVIASNGELTLDLLLMDGQSEAAE